MVKIVLLGPPACGKGTQAKMIAKEIQIPHISSGDLFRGAAEEGTELGIKARDEFWSKGQLVPDEITIGLVKERLEKNDCKEGFILDGFPRTIPQAEALSNVVNLDYVIEITSPDDVIIKRVVARRSCPQCGKIYGLDVPPKNDNVCDECNVELNHRSDDNEETMQQRLDVYHKQTSPLIEFYKEKNLLVTVDGTQKIDKVFEDILSILKK
ncbi:MAG: adenylate kinase [archaeon]